jgi:branched-chain amino acid transport system ATP-binding protein
MNQVNGNAAMANGSNNHTAGTASDAVLSVEGLSKSFGGVDAVVDLSFTLKQGELLALIGPNGAGKTTCFNMINGQLKPDSGQVHLLNKDITGWSPRKIWRQGVGRTFQITATYSSMTEVENVQMALIAKHRKTLSLFGKANRMYTEPAMQLLELTGMVEQADRSAGILAYGDLKRLELAIALAHDPVLLLMDEPTAGMAPRERNELMELVSRIVGEKDLSVLFTEHDMDVVFGHSDRIMVLNRGRLIASGSADEIRNNTQVQEVYLGGGAMYGESDLQTDSTDQRSSDA